jgi:uncharacterized membrane protein
MTLCTPADAPPATMTAAPPVPFDAVLYPYRSLGRFGFHLLMAAIVLVSVAVGAAFMLAGAWPVSGFMGLDVLLLYLAFRWNYRQGRRAEFIRLDGAGLVVRRVDPGGQTREWRFDANWVRVAIESNDQLTLSSHGRSLVVGAFLTPEERLELGKALRAALAEHRQMPDRAPG